MYLEETGAFGRPFNKYDNNFGRFSPTYTVSNEYLSEAMEILKPRGKSVLTVAVSGDQAFFYKINGASHVDTFDISYCAQVMMNVKTAAVQTLDYTGYQEVYLSQEQMSEFYSNPQKNDFGILINQYIIIRDADTKEAVDQLCWTGEEFRQIKFKDFYSQ